MGIRLTAVSAADVRAPTNPGCEEAAVPAPTPPATPEIVNSHDIKVNFAKAYLSEETDVLDYIEELRKTLLAEIRSGKRIIV